MLEHGRLRPERGEPNAETFKCIAQVGTFGNDPPLADSLVEAVSPKLNGPGAYRVDAAPGEVSIFGTVHLDLEGDSLQLRLDSTQSSPKAATITRYALAPVDDRIARIFGVGRGKGQQVLAEDGPDGPSLRWSGCRLVRAT